MVTDSPCATVDLLLLISMVGGVVSGVALRVKLTLLLASAPSVLKLPAASLNLPLSTRTSALTAPTVGLKVAV